MYLVKPTTAGLKRICIIFFTFFIYTITIAQENSPYSRYGVGDLTPNRNILNRGMGGVAAGYSDYQVINLLNPASLGSIVTTIFDLGGGVDIRTLKSNTTPQKFSSVNANMSYLQLGFPISTKRMIKNGNSWGLSFGLRPISSINYKIEKNERLPGVDSLNTIYEGTGGITRINVSTGMKIKKFSFGISTGYAFGKKDYSTQLRFNNDTVTYYSSNTATQTRFGGIFLDAGLQYEIKIKKGILVLGAYGNLQQNLNAKRDNINETIAFDASNGNVNIDTVSFSKDVKGKVTLPASFGTGFTYTERHWVVGADVEMANWVAYRYYGQTDAVQNNWKLRAGAQYFPANENTPANKYWRFVKYRAGIYYGTDYIKLNSSRPDYGITLGAGLPLTSFQWLRRGEYVVMNAGVELGQRGNKQTQSLREGIARFSIGISMNARWFQKPKYD
ncbi:MAG TPA: hypothetical protein VK498_16075 [Ferruginibacter sp.]|nr:hypothetical protein [Ferruginibacter sp.]